MRILSGITILLLLSGVICAKSWESVTTEAGVFIREFPGIPGTRGPVRETSLDDPTLNWSRNLATGIFMSAAVTTDRFAYSGSEQNDPREAAQYEITGNGTPVMALDGISWRVAAASQGDYWAAINRTDSGRCTLYFMNELSPTPVWRYSLGFGVPAAARGLQFSEDGNYLALWFGRADPLLPQLYVWRRADLDSIPEVTYSVATGQGFSARALCVSADGSLFAATADNFCHVVQRSNGAARVVFDIGASTDALAMSPDGEYIMTGFQSARLRHWDGTTYSIQWNMGIGNRMVSRLLISPDYGYCVSLWNSNSYDQNFIRVHNFADGMPIWSYTYNRGGGLQDMPSDADISADGNWFAVGSWGDEASNNPEVLVFSRYFSTPYYGLNMPGSCFSVDLSSDGQYLAACGKHVHANTFGNGGDMYLVDLDIPTSPDPSCRDTVFNVNGLCAHHDTARYTRQIFNNGYIPFIADSLTGFGADISLSDSAIFTTGILPTDSLEITIVYAPPVAGPVIRDFYIYGHGARVRFRIVGVVLECADADENPLLSDMHYELSPVYPNPFNAEARIAFTLEKPSNVTLDLFAIDGRLVTSILNGNYAMGKHSVQFVPQNLSSGIYFLKLNASGRVATQKMVLLK